MKCHQALRGLSWRARPAIHASSLGTKQARGHEFGLRRNDKTAGCAIAGPLFIPACHCGLDADVLAAHRATGKGWQIRVNDAMKRRCWFTPAAEPTCKCAMLFIAISVRKQCARTIFHA